MSEPNPPRRPLATFLRPHAGSQADTDATPLAEPSAPPASASPDIEDSPADASPEPVVEPVAIAGEAPSQVEATMSEPVRAAASGTPLAQAEPVFLRRGGHRLRTPRWQWAVVAALSLLLLLQIALADRARLAAEASTRPWVAGLCSVLRCDLPAWREPAAFSMISRDVRPVPQQAGALQVQASIRNDAQWAQDWPVLRLSLSDADGRVIGSGVFDASDYLGAGAETAGLLEPGQSAQIAFQVKEPAASTVAFNFEFL